MKLLKLQLSILDVQDQEVSRITCQISRHKLPPIRFVQTLDIKDEWQPYLKVQVD